MQIKTAEGETLSGGFVTIHQAEIFDGQINFNIIWLNTPEHTSLYPVTRGVGKGVA